MKAYLDILDKILKDGVMKHNRTGVDTLAIAGAMFEHDMAEGFPLITTKKVPFRLVSTELEFFIKGITDKQWLIDRNVHIWDEWCSPAIVPYANDAQTKERMKAERELGPIYGFQWRHFGAMYGKYDDQIPMAVSTGYGVDQLQNVVDTLKKNPNDRRMIVNAWNPEDISLMALPPCHYGFQVTVIDGKLNLLWNQRSVDTAVGLPFNIASYGLLLHLLAKDAGLKEGKLIGFLGDVHIYENHIDGVRQQLNRPPMPLPKIHTLGGKEIPFSIFDWENDDSSLEGYEPWPTIKFDIAV